MQPIYIIIENGIPYLNAYPSYKSAVNVVKEKHKEYLREQIRELDDFDMIENVLSNINVAEDIETGISKLYIEKGINIEIYKLLYQN